MLKTSKLLFLLVGCIMPIFIGTMHTYVHFKDLQHPIIEDYLQKQFLIAGQEQSIWNTLGVVSFMMGISFICIGLLNLSIIRSTDKTNFLPILPILAMIFYQLGVTYVGHEYNQDFQFYGGIFGLIITIVCLGITLKLRSTK